MDEIRKIGNLIGNILHQILGYSFITIGGNVVTVGNITVALALFLLGIKYFKHFAQLIKQYVQVRMGTDKDTANAIEKLILYSTFTIYIIIILEIANIPLSIFAFIGGALAVAIGLGAQNVIGNFICSLLVMIERPLKIGDVVEIDGIFGTIQSVGARCTVITTPTNVDVLVPNSKLVYNTVVNWTLNDTAVRYQAIIKIAREAYSTYPQVEALMNLLQNIVDSMDSTLQHLNHKINLIKIEETTLSFMINFYFDVQRVDTIEIIKNNLNLELIKNLGNDSFTVDYLKLAQTTSTT